MNVDYLKIFFLIAVITACQPDFRHTNYYFDAENGNDTNSGTSPKDAFKSLNKIRQIKVAAGDSILLKSGSIFPEKLYFSGKGEPGNPVVIGKYGGEKRPFLKGNAENTEMLHIYNSENIVIRDMEVSNEGDRSIDGLCGVKVELEEYGEAKNTTIDNLYIHNITGGLEIKKGGGTALLVENSEENDSVASRFIGLVIEDCILNDCQRDGIRVKGQWIRSKWFPNLGVTIRKNLIDGIPGDGIVVSGCDSALIEYNTLRNFPEVLPSTEACDGIWPWSSDNTVVQFNVVSDHHSLVDGYAYDSDWNCQNSVFQYNLSYNNVGGFMLVIATNGWPESWCVNGNTGTQIKYSISINDGLRDYPTEGRIFSPVVHLTGLTKDTRIEKNLFYVPPKPKPEIDRTILHFTNHDKSFGAGDLFLGNYLSVSEPTILAKEEKSLNNLYSNNFFVGSLQTPQTGFTEYNGRFDQKMWYDKTDANWNKLIEFVKDKTVPLNGEEIPVLKLIGYFD